ncbi:DUF2848 domain-containing protein [Tepidibacillus marianensis]|uniref:DUF2848 domain-containing protein n=1 Tax=Tepidibacillus marianensis TaxID=3131995 RepID=UPI0030CAAB38
MKNYLTLTVQGDSKTLELEVKKIFNAGYAGRNQALVQEHIDELAKVGVPAPTTTPTLYPISNYLATTSDNLQVQHGETSGEIEYVLIWADGELYVTVGSDHTDRNLENYSVPKSKQACPNVIPPEVWKFDDVKDHWDELELECWVTKGGKRDLYQKAKLAALLSPDEWSETFDRLSVAEDGNIFYSATVNTVGNMLVFGDQYEIELKDPVLNKSIKHAYHVEVLQKGIE